MFVDEKLELGGVGVALVNDRELGIGWGTFWNRVWYSSCFTL